MTTSQPPDRPAAPRPQPTYTYEPPIHRRTNYTPTPEQLARDEKQKRYMRRNVYAPTIIAALIALGLFILIILLAFFIKSQGGPARAFIAGMSAFVVILFTIPAISFLALISIAYFGYQYYRWEQRRQFPEVGPTAYRSRIQLLLWQIESYLDIGRKTINRGADAATGPLIKLHSRAAYIQQWGRSASRGARDLFTRSKPNDLDINEEP